MNIKKINVGSKEYIFNEIDLENYVKLRKQNTDVSFENLKDARYILDKIEITWGVIFGTLLGAYREENLIEHDTDTDIFLMEEQKNIFLSHLDIFLKNGFEIARYDGKVVSLIRNEEFIDFYFLKKGFFTRRVYKYHIENEHFRKVEKVKIRGEYFNTLTKIEKFLIKMYGINWNTPIKNRHAEGRREYRIEGILLKLFQFLGIK